MNTKNQHIRVYINMTISKFGQDLTESEARAADLVERLKL